MKKLTLLSALILTVGFLNLGCEKEELNKIAEAQTCLDDATVTKQGSASAAGSKATECIQKVEGLESADASRIRCGATYIQRGFTTDTFKTAYTQIKTPPANENPTLSMMSYLAFIPGNANNATTGRSAAADSAYIQAECEKSKSPGLIYIASATRIATLISNAAGGAGCSSGNVNCLQAAAAAAAVASPAEVGAAALAAYSSYCVGGSSQNSAACSQFNQAVTAAGGTGNLTTLGTQLLDLLDN